MKKILALILVFNVLLSFSQIGMQQWRIHFSGFQGKGITETNDNIFMACSNGIVRYDLEDNSVNQLSVTNGLSDLNISAIGSDENVAIVGYVSGNLDVIENNRVTNVPWIKRAEISGDKTIHNFYFKDDYIYISTGIGLILYDNARKEIKDTYYPYEAPVINDVTIHNDTLYAATQLGIYFAPKDRPFLNDKTQWEKYTNLPATVINSNFNQIESFDSKLIFSYDVTAFNEDTLYYVENGELNYFEGGPFNIRSINADEDLLIVSYSSSVDILNKDLEREELIYNYPEYGAPSPKSALKQGGYYWISDQNTGMIKATNSFSSSAIYNNTPFRDGSYRIDIQFGKVIIAGGGLTANLQNIFSRNGVYIFEDEEWTNFNYTNHDSLDINKNWDFISVAVNPNNTDEFAFGSFSQGGLSIVKDGKTISEKYNYNNSYIEHQAEVMLLGDMKYDDNGNLWVVNKGIEPLKVFMADGTQHSYSLGGPAKNKIPYRLAIDEDGNKWVAVAGGGLVAFNENGTFDDPSDDQTRTLSASEGNGNLPSSFVKALAVDADGEIWIGTEEGLVILYNKTNLYDGEFGEFDAKPILLEVGEEVERLLGDTYVTAIAIDGGNRKWVGTNSSGVFCFSEDGSEEIYRFNTENSPLVSNNVLDIKVDQLSGEVYFATDNGLVSFRSDATLADKEFSSVSVFPNPVRPEFSGPITIQGLGYESDVKVTDISGNLIYQTVSNGGSVIWNGKNLAGDRVQSGVYLVWSGITTGKGKNVAKILFIN